MQKTRGFSRDSTCRGEIISVTHLFSAIFWGYFNPIYNHRFWDHLVHTIHPQDSATGAAPQVEPNRQLSKASYRCTFHTSPGVPVNLVGGFNIFETYLKHISRYGVKYGIRIIAAPLVT